MKGEITRKYPVPYSKSMTRQQVTGYDRSSLLGRIVLAWDTSPKPSEPEGHGLLIPKLQRDLKASNVKQKKEPQPRGLGFTNFTPEALRMLPVEAAS